MATPTINTELHGPGMMARYVPVEQLAPEVEGERYAVLDALRELASIVLEGDIKDRRAVRAIHAEITREAE